MVKFLQTLMVAFSGPVFLVIGAVIIFYTFRTINVDLLPVLSLILLFAPIWIPLTLFWLLEDRWMEYIELKYQAKSGRVTLEITLPQEVYKSPQAMEDVLTQTWQNNKPYNLGQAYWKGKQPIAYGLEVVSTGGSVKFYASLPIKKAKDVFEAQLYAQYPGIEVKEVPLDYTAEIQNDFDKWEWMSFHFVKAEDDVYPIKTYVDWGLDENPKDEEVVEPMAPMLEFLASIKPYERVWVQFLALSHTKKGFGEGALLKPQKTWTKDARKEVDKIMQRDENKIGEAEYEGMPRLTTGERDLVTAIERNTSKLAYEVALRVLVAAPTGKFKFETISSMTRVFKGGFTYVGRNDMAIRWRTDFDYNFFSDFSGRRKKYYKKKELDLYKLRAYIPFSVKKLDRMKVMSVEELATMWHIPGKAIVTPGVTRVESLRQDAPANLPIGDGTAWKG